MSLPVLYPKTQKEWTDIGFSNIELLPGKGAQGCVLTGIQNGKKKLLKVVFSQQDTFDETQKTVLREAYIGHRLGNISSPANSMFAETELLIIMRGIPDVWPLDDACRKASQTAEFVHIIVQRFIEGWSFSSWLKRQDKELSGSLIRGVLFQLVYALGIAQHEIGFIHNDLKAENIMISPTKEAKKTFVFNSDVFDVTTEGISVTIIDMGGAVLFQAPKVSDWPFEPSELHTVGYTPIESVYYAELMKNRRYTADFTALGVFFLTMIAHRRQILPPNFGFENPTWVYDGSEYFVNLLTRPAIQSTIENHIDELTDALVTKDPSLRPGEAQSITQLFLPYVLMNIALNIKVTSVPSKTFEIVKHVLNEKHAFRTKLDTIVSGKGAKLTQIFDTVKTIGLKLAFPEESMQSYAFSMLRILFFPFEQNRIRFGVQDYAYGFANAVYHPFFATVYWIASECADIPSVQFLQPFAYGVIDNETMEKENTRDFFKKIKKSEVVPDFPKKQKAAVVSTKGIEWPVFPARFYSDTNPIPQEKTVVKGNDIWNNVLRVNYVYAIAQEIITSVFDTKKEIPKGISKDALQVIATKQLEPLANAASILFNTEYDPKVAQEGGNSDAYYASSVLALANDEGDYSVPTGFKSETTNVTIPTKSAPTYMDFSDIPVIPLPDGTYDTEAFLIEIGTWMFKFLGIARVLKTPLGTRPSLDDVASAIEAYQNIPENTPYVTIINTFNNSVAVLIEKSTAVLRNDTEDTIDDVAQIMNKIIELSNVDKNAHAKKDEFVKTLPNGSLQNFPSIMERLSQILQNKSYIEGIPALKKVLKKTLDTRFFEKDGIERLKTVFRFSVISQQKPKSYPAAMEDVNMVDKKAYYENPIDITRDKDGKIGSLYFYALIQDLLVLCLFLLSKIRDKQMSKEQPDLLKLIKSELTPSHFTSLFEYATTFLKKIRIPVSAKARIQATLETIERNAAYMDAFGNYKVNCIETDLIEPLRGDVTEHLPQIAELLGLYTNGSLQRLNDFDKTVQTRYLHCLSNVAGALAENRHTAQDFIDTCHSEWPFDVFSLVTGKVLDI